MFRERMMKLNFLSGLECIFFWNNLLSVVFYDGGFFWLDCCGVGYSFYWLFNIFNSCIVFEKKKNYKLSFWYLFYDNKEILIFFMLVIEKFYVLKYIEFYCLYVS